MLQLRSFLTSSDTCKAGKGKLCGTHTSDVVTTPNRISSTAHRPSDRSQQAQHPIIVAAAAHEASRRNVVLSQLALCASPLFALPAAAAGPAAAGTCYAAGDASSSAAGQPCSPAANAASQPELKPASTATAAAQDRQTEVEDGAAEDNDSDSSSDDAGDLDEDDSSSSSSSDEDADDLVSSNDQQQQDPPSSSDASDTSPNAAGASSSSNDANSSSSSSSTSISATPNSSSSSSNMSGNGRSTKPGGKGSLSANLSVKSYLEILQSARKASWPLIAQKISAGEWIALSQVLVQPPFDDVRQACFYIPWALLQYDDFTAAVAARKAYVDFIDHVHALATIALKAADGVAGADVQVQQAFLLLNASVDAYLAAVPRQYSRATA